MKEIKDKELEKVSDGFNDSDDYEKKGTYEAAYKTSASDLNGQVPCKETPQLSK